MKINVERDLGPEPLNNKRVWNFCLLVHAFGKAPELTLDEVVDQRRESPRHKYKLVGQWSRLYREKRSMERPEPPADVLEEATKILVASLRFT